jgi:hypothetical protein
MSSNKKQGTQFEKRLAKLYAEQGWWVHLIEPGPDGSQPADLIIVKNQVGRLIDAKVLTNKTGRFPFSRIEENQKLTYKRWAECGNMHYAYMIAILWNNNVYEIPYCNIENLEGAHGEKSINIEGWLRFENIDR